MTDLRFIQIALNTIDLAASVRFHHEVFGYINGGGQVGWGDVMLVQGLEPGGQTLVWWMFGRHPRIQFEIFFHTGPRGRPKPEDWSPADHGWVRYGTAVADFDLALQKLSEHNIMPLGPIFNVNGLRRCAIRDPWCGIIVEIFEDGEGLPRTRTPENANTGGPLILYATASVSDLAAARRYYSDILRMQTAPLELLHSESDELLWGLAGAKRKGFLVEAGNGFLEIVEYASPKGRARGAGHRISDQGIMNIGLSCRETGRVQAIIDRLDAEGKGPDWLTIGENLLGIYVNDPDREIELLACPAEVEAQLGFMPRGEFNGGNFIKMVPRKM